jgi:hypothetical protein
VRCGVVFSGLIYAPTPYSMVFLLHPPAPAPIKISAMRCDVVWCGSCGFLGYVGEAYTPKEEPKY